MKLQFGLFGFALVHGVVSAAIKDFDFSLVGYAKTNPLGETTGGKAGATTTVRDSQALVTAVAVRYKSLQATTTNYIGKHTPNGIC